MAEYFRNLGMEFLEEDEVLFKGIVGLAAQEGNVITGYHGLPYINHHLGAVQLIVSCDKAENEKSYEITKVDTHVSGRMVWKLRCDGIDLTPKDAPKTEKRCIFSDAENGGGMLVINVVNADVIPSYLKGDIVELQMVFFPEYIEYFADEESYHNSLEKTVTGQTWGIGNGSVLPVGFMKNHTVGEDGSAAEADDRADSMHALMGTVKNFQIGKVDLGEDGYDGFVRCFIDTLYGELELVHTIDQVDESQLENMKAGATVSAVGLLSGDAAIYDYDHGIIRDQEHNIRLLRSVFQGDDPGRLATVLTEDAEYQADTSGETYKGKESIISRIRYVQETNDDRYFAKAGKIVEIDEGEDALRYPVGTRCIVLASGSEENYESIAFVEYTEDGFIRRIHTSTESRYHFSIDEIPAAEFIPQV